MLEIETLADLRAYVGKPLGTSDWVTIDQQRIDDFSRVSGDDNWIHVDVERAKKELPGGRTMAHGMLTLSLVTWLGGKILRVRQRSRGINYGSNKVRYTSPVQVGARIRGRQKLLAADDMPNGGIRMTYQWTVEIEGKDRPACVAETMSIAYAKT